MLVLFSSGCQGFANALLFGPGLFKVRKGLLEGVVGRFKTRHKRLKFVVGLAELLPEHICFLGLLRLFVGCLLQAVVVEFNRYVKGLNGLAELGGFATRKAIDFVLQLGNFVVQFQDNLLGGLVLIKKSLTFSEVFLAFLDVKGKFVFQRGVPRLEEHGVREVDGVRHLFRLLRNVSLLCERREALKLFLFEESDFRISSS